MPYACMNSSTRTFRLEHFNGFDSNRLTCGHCCRTAIYGAIAVLLNRSSGLALPGKCDALHHDFGAGVDVRPGGEEGGSPPMQNRSFKLR